MNFTVIDTPGISQSNGQDSQSIDEMMNYLRNEIKSTNVFLLVFNGLEDSIDGMLHQILRDLQIMFGKDMWNHVVLGFTNWKYDSVSVSDRERQLVQ